MTIRPLDIITPAPPVLAQNGDAFARAGDELSREELLARLGIGAQLITPSPVADTIATAAIPQRTREWIAVCQSLLQAKGTITSKRDALGKLHWWLETHGRSRCGAVELQEFLSYVAIAHTLPNGRWGRAVRGDPEAARFRKPISARTLRYYYVYIRGFFSWLEESGIVQAVALSKIRIARQKRTLIQPFTPEQFESLIKAARRSTQPRRDEAIFMFLYDTGLRASELCGLRLCNLEFDKLGIGGRVKFVGKGGKERIVPFARRARTLLWNYLLLAPRSGAGKVFVAERGWHKGCGLTRDGLLQLFHRTGAVAGITGVRCSPHTMRHTFAINFLRRGGDIRTLAYLMGHESLNQTMKYLAIAEADAENQHRLCSPADGLEFS
jgi:site-specific recombinase XerD